MHVACPAKINLTLEVLDRRDDGYHALRSVMVPLDLADMLELEPASEFTFACSDETLAGNDNLAARAFHALGLPGGSVRLTKTIPTQAGMGGGSSDAAGVLLGAMRGAFGPVPQLDWVATARALGSDVPFFLVEGGALVEGTGERVTALGPLPPWHVLAIKPPAGISTKDAYAAIDAHPRPSRPRSSSVSLEMVEAVQRGQFERVVSLLNNDFEAPVAVLTPEVARALDALRAAGARPLLSGSGSAVFALASDPDTIAAIDERIDLPSAYRRFRTRFRTEGAWR